MNKTPVRETLLPPRAEGFVEFTLRRSIRVVPVTLRDIDETLEITAVELNCPASAECRDIVIT